MPEINKRAYERYDLQFSVQVRWKDATGNEKEETAMTQDISFSGVFIVSRSLIEKGCEIDVEIDLPVTEAGATKRRVSALGQVVRNVSVTHRDKGGFGHAVKFDEFHFLRP